MRICQWCGDERDDVEEVVDPVMTAIRDEDVLVSICGYCRENL